MSQRDGTLEAAAAVKALGRSTYLVRLKLCMPTERGVRLTFSSGHEEKTIELSRDAAGQILQALQNPTAEEPLTLTVLGHQVVQSREDKGLLLKTREWGTIVFSLPQAILLKLVSDLAHLVSSPPHSAQH